ncbi:restriction endonuclease subunit S [Pseudomonas aeruginosa]|nr:restriction endonuclease subunit S [Pseudomonas aeruginosa]
MQNYEQQFKSLTDIGSIGRGKSKHRPRNDPSLYGGDHPFIQTGDVKAASFYLSSYSQTYNERGLAQSKLWQPGTLCITIAANIAETAILKIPACFPDSIIGFLPKRDVADVRFVKYCLDTYKQQMQRISQGTTQDNLSQEKLLGIKFKIPSFQDQQKIAAALSAYDDLIENNCRRIELLEQIAEELYREWFVRFRFPGYQQVKFKKGSPSTWQKKKFGEFCGLKRGYDLPDAQIEDGRFPIIASTSIKASHNQFKVEPPVICTGRSGSLGTVLFVNERAWPLNTALYVQKFYGNSPYIIYFTLKNMGLASFNSGAGVPSLNRNHLNGILIAVPDKTLQQAFDKHVSVLFEQKEQLVEACKSLEKARDALLTRLISGTLPVDQLDIQFPTSMREADTARQEVAHA